MKYLYIFDASQKTKRRKRKQEEGTGRHGKARSVREAQKMFDVNFHFNGGRKIEGGAGISSRCYLPTYSEKLPQYVLIWNTTYTSSRIEVLSAFGNSPRA